MRDVIGAAAEGAVVPGVDQIEDERRVDRDRRVQAVRRLPRAVADAGDEFALRAGRMQRDAAAIAGDDVPRRRSGRVTFTCMRSSELST